MNTQNPSNSRGKLLSVIISIVLAIVLIFGYCVWFYQYDYKKTSEREAISLSGYNKEVCINLERKFEFAEEYIVKFKRQYITRMKLCMVNILRMTEEDIVALFDSGFLDTYIVDAYLFDKNRVMMMDISKHPFTLTDKEMDELLLRGQLEMPGRTYIAQCVDTWIYVLACNTQEPNLDKLDFNLSTAVSYVVLDENSLEVLQKSDDLISDLFENYDFSDAIEHLKTCEGDTSVYRIKKQGKHYLICSRSVQLNDENVYVCTLTESDLTERKALFCSVAAGMMLLMFALSCILIIHMLKDKHYVLTEELQRDGLKNKYRKSFRSNLISTQVSAGVITLLFFVQIMLMCNTIQIDEEIVVAITNLSNLNESYDHNQKLVDEYESDVGRILLDDVVNSMNFHHQDDENEWLKQLTTILNVKEITVYDKDGLAVFSSEPSIGYKLSTCETDDEYKLWHLLKGSSREMIFDGSDGTYYLAVRRTDDVGIIVMKSDDSTLGSLHIKSDLTELLKMRDYADTDKLYITRNSPETLYIIESGSNVEKTVLNTLPVPENGETIIGMRTILGEDYLYINMGSRDWAIAFAYPVKELLAYLTTISAASTAMIIILMVSMLLCSRGELLRSSVQTQCDYQTFMTHKKKLIQSVLTVIAMGAACILFVHNAFIENHILISEFFDSWETGVNFISISCILLGLGITIGMCLLLSFIDTLLCKFLSPRTATVCTLLICFLRVVLIVTMIIICLEQLGVNAASITASLGITGLALGIGSKDVISDLVAGAFIIFEGQIQLGDVIQVNGFSGQVISLGIRTVKLRKLNQEMILNNTSLKNVINSSRGIPLISIRVIVPFNTEFDRLKAVINESSERVNAACGGKLLSNLNLVGISEFKDYGMECLFSAKASLQDVPSCTIKCQTELKKILDENGFEIAIRKDD